MSKGNEREEIAGICMDKAHKALRAAKTIEEKDSCNSVTLAYYCMFHAAHSALLAEGAAAVKSHEELKSKFSETFVDTGRFSKDVFNMIEEAEKNHHKVEYEPQTVFSLQEALRCIKNADRFFDAVEKMLAKEPEKSRGKENQPQGAGGATTGEARREKRIAELDEDLKGNKNKYLPGTTEFQQQYNKANELFRLEKERGTDEEEARRRHPEAMAVLLQAAAHQSRNR